jgi:hypothetical protein
MTAELDTHRLILCPKRPSKQPVAGSNPARARSSDQAKRMFSKIIFDPPVAKSPLRSAVLSGL